MCSGLENSICVDLLSGPLPGHGLNSGFLMFKMSGSVQMESALLYTFLEVSSDCKFREQLHSLQSQEIVSFLKGGYYSDDEVELQTDGNRSGHLQNGELGECSFLHPTCFSEGGVFLSLFPIFAAGLFQRSNVFSIEKLHSVVGGGVGWDFNTWDNTVLRTLSPHGFLEHPSPWGFVCSTSDKGHKAETNDRCP